jgi:starch phosphorylase
MDSEPKTIVSITPEIALDHGYTFAGGLGVLEGDKFYTAGRLGLDYYVVSLLYRSGYIDYSWDENGNPIPSPQRQPEEFLKSLSLSGEFEITLRGEKVKVKAWEYRYKTAKAIFLEPDSPEWAKPLTERVFIEKSEEERFYKYLLLAKGAVAFIKEVIGLENIAYIDLQEAYTAIIPIVLKIPGRYRLIIHTPGPWGHPSFPRSFFAKELGYHFIDNPVVLTSIGAAMANEVIMVSSKHFDIMRKVIPHLLYKARFITNGVDIERWMNPKLRELLYRGELDLSSLKTAKKEARSQLVKLISSRKPMNITEDTLIFAWARRVTKYKRPYFPIRLIEELEDRDVVFVLGGKSHPEDKEGIQYMKKFKELEKKKPNVVYFHDYGIETAKTILSGSDVLAFTPFQGWEASGTSFMKAAINGVPSIASRDGAVVELLEDGVNSWLFGEDIRELIDFGRDPRVPEIDERDYKEFKEKFLAAKNLYMNDSEEFCKISLSAVLTTTSRVDMKRVLREYYPDLVD